VTVTGFRGFRFLGRPVHDTVPSTLTSVEATTSL